MMFFQYRYNFWVILAIALKLVLSLSKNSSLNILTTLTNLVRINNYGLIFNPTKVSNITAMSSSVYYLESMFGEYLWIILANLCYKP
jgi:hypothetical protein